MPKFSIKDLLIATTLVASGIGMLSFMVNYDRYVDGEQPIPGYVICMFGGCALIGCGLFTPFKRPSRGVWLGLFTPIVLWVLVMVAVWMGWVDVD